jgi:hypothetical protein
MIILLILDFSGEEKARPNNRVVSLSPIDFSVIAGKN